MDNWKERKTETYVALLDMSEHNDRPLHSTGISYSVAGVAALQLIERVSSVLIA